MPRAKPTPPTLRSLLTERVKGYAALATPIIIIGSALGSGLTAWVWFGLPTPVSDRALQTSIMTVQSDVKSKVESAKEEVQRDVGGVKKQIEGISKKTDQHAITMLETQQRTLFLQKTSLTGSLTNVEIQLRKNPSDAFLLQRKMELQNIISYIDRESAAVQDQLRTAKNGQQQ